ncbi:MAG: single-strand DNA-binding protein [Thermoleophilaceae bacterium]|nr:single-strand DNA-binding protein [Thermoleophilaceae bacterium]
MNSFNVSGNLTDDPRVVILGNGKVVANMRIAVAQRFHPKEKDYFAVVAWQDLAEQCGEWLSKGRRIDVTGRIKQRHLPPKEPCGCIHTFYEVTADEVGFGEGGATRH